MSRGREKRGIDDKHWKMDIGKSLDPRLDNFSKEISEMLYDI